MSYGRVESCEPHAGSYGAILSTWNGNGAATGEKSRKQSLVSASDILHTDSIHDRISQKVQHREEINDVKFGVQHGIWDAVIVHMRRDEVKHHVG